MLVDGRDTSKVVTKIGVEARNANRMCSGGWHIKGAMHNNGVPCFVTRICLLVFICQLNGRVRINFPFASSLWMDWQPTLREENSTDP